MYQNRARKYGANVDPRRAGYEQKNNQRAQIPHQHSW